MKDIFHLWVYAGPYRIGPNKFLSSITNKRIRIRLIFLSWFIFFIRLFWFYSITMYDFICLGWRTEVTSNYAVKHFIFYLIFKLDQDLSPPFQVTDAFILIQPSIICMWITSWRIDTSLNVQLLACWLTLVKNKETDLPLSCRIFIKKATFNWVFLWTINASKHSIGILCPLGNSIIVGSEKYNSGSWGLPRKKKKVLFILPSCQWYFLLWSKIMTSISTDTSCQQM